MAEDIFARKKRKLKMYAKVERHLAEVVEMLASWEERSMIAEITTLRALIEDDVERLEEEIDMHEKGID